MRYTQETGTIRFIAEIAPGIYNCLVHAPKIAAAASVGQFVNVLCGGYELRRPISLCGFDAGLGLLRLVFEVRGKGTRWLSQRQAGEELDLVGPLGHGFPLMDRNSRAVLVGGGIGTPPLLPLAQRYGSGATAITGFRSGTAAILQDDLAGTGADCRLCTDDGSAGFHGFTTQMLEQRLNEGACDVVYTCGPKVMMKRVAAMALEQGIPCYVSMEERMGCGVGACLGCVCGTKAPDREKKMTRVCLNGPVFDAREVVWE